MENNKKIGILTITPNIGFGGIMQAYALRQMISTLCNDLEVEIINYRDKPTFISRLAYLKNAFKRKFLKAEFVKFSPESAYRYIAQNILPFHERYLKYSSPVSPGNSFRQLVNQRYSVIIVGSDQVWRPKYVHSIKDYFLEGISDNVSKIAYAASLGASVWEYTREETEVCQKLINKFDYVSVRESEGVSLLKNNMDCVVAVHNDVDPTLLLEKENYKQFMTEKTPKGIFTYILDRTKDKEDLIENIAAVLNLPVYRFNTGAENPNLPLKERIAPSIQEWISGIANSDFVVTDSFHGCVFSIIFNKPFIIYANKDRGLDRFTSLLGSLGLMDRMVFTAEEMAKHKTDEKINWTEINIRLDSLRNNSLNRLANILREKLQ